MRFVQKKVTPENLDTLLAEHLSAGDLLIDLAWNIDCGEIVQWCHDHGVLYINTSVELWDPYAGAGNKHPTERTLYWRHMNLRRMVAGWKEPGPTAVLEHGANPGLISHFTKQGLLDIAERALAERKFAGAQAEKVAHHAKAQEFNHLARELGVKVIHCSERDTQITDRPKEVDEFVNTWSVEGFREEGTTTAEMGWGTHEKELPALAFEHAVRPEEPDLPGAHGHQHVRGQLGAAESPHRRHGRPPRRVVHHHREADRVGGRQGRLSSDGALRVLSVRLARSRRSTSCAGSTTSCSRACAS